MDINLLCKTWRLFQHCIVEMYSNVCNGKESRGRRALHKRMFSSSTWYLGDVSSIALVFFLMGFSD